MTYLDWGCWISLSFGIHELFFWVFLYWENDNFFAEENTFYIDTMIFILFYFLLLFFFPQNTFQIFLNLPQKESPLMLVFKMMMVPLHVEECGFGLMMVGYHNLENMSNGYTT